MSDGVDQGEQEETGGATIGDPNSGSLDATINYCRCNKLECTATALSIIGGFFNPLLDPTLRLVGFLLWFAGNLLWVRFSYTHGKWGMFLMQFMFGIQNFAGIANMLFNRV
jgi:hypothetical protein